MAGRIGTVVRLRPIGATKQVTLDNERCLSLPRFAIVGKGDVLQEDGRGLYIDVRNGRARVFPSYARPTRIQIGTRIYHAQVKEIDRDDELEAYYRLGDLHYRSERGFGRKAVLIVRASHPELPKILGYVEVTTGFLMNKPRTRVLNAPFRDGAVRWSEWHSAEMQSLTSLVCRISRLVVHPELRGHGIGTVLVEQAAHFARTRFRAGGLRPLFMELTADMTKFVPFAERAGMRYIGDTEGNLHRVAKDMEYLLKSKTLLNLPTSALKARGIMHAQRRYAASAALLVERDGLGQLASNGNGHSAVLGSDAYTTFFGVLRLPKPTYLLGLTVAAERFVADRVAKLNVTEPLAFAPSALEPISEPIELRDLGLTFQSGVARTSRANQIQEAFGIRPDHFQSLVVKGLSVSLSPGSTTLVFGPSGSGKTTLLNFIAGLPNEHLSDEGALSLPANARIGRFEDLPGDRPLIEVLGEETGIASALYALNVAGLSDAKLYLRRFGELSNGQRYRAMLAALIDSDSNVWVADEFLSTLDPLTAASVASNIVEHVRARNVTLVVGAPHFDAFLDVLQPDLVVRLVSPWEHEVLLGQEFTRRWRHRPVTE
jgi:ABC-type lipoprotein export system ATPase subunit/GNAT superfamily N-acetyltransferase